MSLDAQRLVAWLPHQRWFGGKARVIERVEVVDQAIVEDGPPELLLVLARVHFTDGGGDLYHLPLLVNEDGTFEDAVTSPHSLAVLGDLLAHGVTIKGSDGTFDFLGPGLDPLQPPGSSGVRSLGVEQSNSSLVFDEKVILKLLRRVDVGHNPDLELTRLLTDRRFENVPPHVGDVSYTGGTEDEEMRVDLGIAQRFEPDGRDAWAETLRRLDAFYDEVHPLDVAEDYLALTEDRAGSLLQSIEELGEATAALHIMLSTEDPDPSFLPETIDPYDLKLWARQVRVALARELALEPALSATAAAIEARVDQLDDVVDAGLKTRIHGDYHLGQVLATPRGWMVLDFEGEPARAMEERREKQSPLRDVAGMLRSFSYAASAALFARARPGSEAWSELEPWANTWEELARDRFLSAYLRKSHEGRFLPGDPPARRILLDVFEIDKALYELGYERGNRPEWIRIPLRGIEQAAVRDVRR
ncbi:MAG: phosphotransferase [Actinomycetota bacterium]|nr:phosphotransferase [Actinomycetota bacterium]